MPKENKTMSDSRLFHILYYLLNKERATAPELAEKFEVSQRTIYRDIEALSGAGIPVYAEPGRNGGISLLQDFVLDRALLSRQEKQETLAALQSISATGSALAMDTLAKLSALFHIEDAGWLEVDFSRWGKKSADSAKFEQLKTAVIQHREINIVYENTNSQTSVRTVQPLKLSYKSKEWYLKAFCLEKQDFRMFKLNRILHLDVLDQTFVPKLYPEAEPDYGQTCPKIALLFSKEIAYRIYDEFDETQIARQDNGDFLVSARLPVDQWLIGYLLSFGAQVEVKEPAYLREILAAQAREIYQKHSEKNKP
jgi:predicted DNA-binding transcriptional regulator YafY